MSIVNIWNVFVYHMESVLIHKQIDTDKNNKTQQLSSSYDPINVCKVQPCPYCNHHATTTIRTVYADYK